MKNIMRKLRNKIRMPRKFIFVLFACLFVSFALCHIVSAYTFLQPLPDNGDVLTSVDGDLLSTYLTWLYRFMLGAAAFLALIKIVIGGAYIIVGGASETAQSKGREMIEMALWGLLLAVTSWLILNSINPALVNGSFSLPEISITVRNSNPNGNSGVNTTASVVNGGSEDAAHQTEQDSAIGQPSVGTPSADIANLRNYANQMDATNSSVLIDKSDKKMYVYYNGELIATVPINIGANDLSGTKDGGTNGDRITPVGEFTITSDRRADFTNGVYNSNGVNMGPVFLGLSAVDQNGNYRGIGIHGSLSGTLKPTAGCIRVGNSDLSAINAALKSGIKIKIRN